MRLQFNTDDLPPQDRLPFWHDVVCREIYPVTPGPCADPVSFRARLDVLQAGPYALANLRTSNGRAARTAADLARDTTGNVVLYRVLGGTQQYRFGADEMLMRPGDIGIATNREFECATPDGIAFQAPVLPQASVLPLLARGHAHRVGFLPRASPLAGLLSSALDAAAEQVPLLGPALAAAVLGNLAGLAALAWGGSSDARELGRDAVRAARLAAVKRHIGVHLASPGLSPASVAAAFGMSPRYLHTLFENSGESFAQHVMARRLDACRAALESPHAAPRLVTDIAFGFGFNSLATFYRAFQARFGAAPGALRAMPPGTLPALPPGRGRDIARNEKNPCAQ